VTGRPLPGEFELIERFFAPLAASAPGALGLRDDAALIDLPPGHQLVVTADALVAGVHFRDDDPADLVARKALRVNVSDLAAKGARPYAYFLTVAFSPSVDGAWVERFAAGLAADQAEYGLALMGGDTTATPGPTTLSITALGLVRDGLFLRRAGAAAGDQVFVSGTVGDGALGLRVLDGRLKGLSEADRRFLIERYQLPRPRPALGLALATERLASAALDVSDGVAADLGHLAQASNLGAVVEAARLPLSPAARAAVAADPSLWGLIVSGGDDYEIMFTGAPDKAGAVAGLARGLDLALTPIGRMEPGKGVRVLDPAGAVMALERTGYRHF
jgi:thiamine-monophosphate kinase